MTTRNAQLLSQAKIKTKPSKPFDPSDVRRSTTLHLDYTGPLPDVASAGTRYFQVSCWGGYINIQPLQSLRHDHTTVALKATVEFFRGHGVALERIHMDNQQSSPLLLMAKKLNVSKTGPRFTIREKPKQIGKGYTNGQESSHLGTGGVSPGLPNDSSRQMPVPD